MPTRRQGTIYIGIYPESLQGHRRRTSTKVVGSIPFKLGRFRAATAMSRDRTRFYTVEAGMEKVEIIDIAAQEDASTTSR